MRFTIIRKADAITEAGGKATTELLAAMTSYMERMHKAGILLGGDGLKPTAKGKRVRFRRGKPSVIDGPFTEAKELIAGFTIIDVPSIEDAVWWAEQWPVEDGDVELEIRPCYEADDFAEAFTPELRERDNRMREEIEARASRS